MLVELGDDSSHGTACSNLHILLDDLERVADESLRALGKGGRQHIVHAEAKRPSAVQMVLREVVGEPEDGGAGKRRNHRGGQAPEARDLRRLLLIIDSTFGGGLDARLYRVNRKQHGVDGHAGRAAGDDRDEDFFSVELLLVQLGVLFCCFVSHNSVVSQI